MVTSAKMILCDTCNVWVKAQGIGTHRRQKHRILQNKTPMCAGQESTVLLNQIQSEMENFKRSYINTNQNVGMVEQIVEKLSHSSNLNIENDLTEKIEKLNSQMEKILSRIQNIENILRF
ncbi:MAG: hypothetical protein FI718_09295 [SAR202 cluster bacterium]|nr:hypothetical protein [SAR202 cluster bacterium]|tara:strand:+ start:654 stop:1013 length:360 start_codon:yes stop_codon:yes gene_type:complete